MIEVIMVLLFVPMVIFVIGVTLASLEPNRRPNPFGPMAGWKPRTGERLDWTDLGDTGGE